MRARIMQLRDANAMRPRRREETLLAHANLRKMFRDSPKLLILTRNSLFSVKRVLFHREEKQRREK